MALATKERKQLESMDVGSHITFKLADYAKIARMVADLNRKERAYGNIKMGQFMWVVRREGAPNGKFNALRLRAKGN